MIMAAMNPPAATSPPTLRLMNAAFLLAGLATFLLGPILPLLTTKWSLTDQQAGLLLLAQFTGATLGGATVSRRLPQAFLLGTTVAAVGFFVFANAPGLPLACAGLLVAGFGVGRIIASVNIIAGDRYTQHRGSALARLNIAFALGCLLSPLLAAWLTPRFPLALILDTFAALFAAIALALWQELRKPTPQESTLQPIVATSLFTPIFLLFASILFLYGALETCLSAWLTTYALRYGQTSLVLSQYTLVLLLCGLTAGRYVASLLLKKIPEATLLRIALLLTIATAAALASARTAPLIATLAVILGICLAPIFPSAFALYMAAQPTPSQAGLVLAASGLGAASIPWLMGVVSTQTHSLRLALTLPILTAVALLLLSWKAQARPAQTPVTS
jgi:FHS family glucose/mannose:H+ symporter-like MFS transporter